jgi:hypothetical protein
MSATPVHPTSPPPDLGRAGAPAPSASAGLSARVVAGARASGGAYLLLDLHARTEVRLRPHVVERERLHVWVLDGEVRVRSDGGVQTARGAEGLTLAPGTPRAVALAPGTRALCLVVPGGGEHLVELLDADRDEDDVAALLATAGVRVLSRNLWTS